MDQFEAARLKTAQREERKVRYATKSPDSEMELAQHVAPKVFKEKPQKNGIFTISVDMPHTQFTFTLVKQSILSHASSNRLTQDEIRKHIIQGLKPLLGGLD